MNIIKTQMQQLNFYILAVLLLSVSWVQTNSNAYSQQLASDSSLLKPQVTIQQVDTVKHKIYDQFPFYEYDHVVAHSYNIINGTGEDNEIINSSNKLHRSAEKPGVTLTAEQVKRILGILNDKKTHLGGAAACFDPRMGLVFYDKNGNHVSHVSICFECNRLRSSPDIEAQITAIEEKNLFGLSKKGRKQLQKFCVELGLKSCNEPSELFD